jgi:hypothetical protein
MTLAASWTLRWSGWWSEYPGCGFDHERPIRRRADSLVFRGLEPLPVRFD